MYHPYTDIPGWYPRPNDDMDTVQVQIGSKTATFTAADTFSACDLILIDDDGDGPFWQATTDVTHSGDTFGPGDALSTAIITPRSSDPKAHSTDNLYSGSGAIIGRSIGSITPNYDGIDDEVAVQGNGPVVIKSYAQIDSTANIKSIIGDNTTGYTDGRTWDGRGNGYGPESRYSPFVPFDSYVMCTDGKYAGVRCDPTQPYKVRPGTLAISPNGDDTSESLKIYYELAEYNSTNSVELWRIHSDLTETFVYDNTDADITDDFDDTIIGNGPNTGAPPAYWSDDLDTNPGWLADGTGAWAAPTGAAASDDSGKIMTLNFGQTVDYAEVDFYVYQPNATGAAFRFNMGFITDTDEYWDMEASAQEWRYGGNPETSTSFASYNTFHNIVINESVEPHNRLPRYGWQHMLYVFDAGESPDVIKVYADDEGDDSMELVAIMQNWNPSQGTPANGVKGFAWKNVDGGVTWCINNVTVTSNPDITNGDPIHWTGKEGSNSLPGGYYRLKIKNASGDLLAAPKIELLDKQPIPTGNWQNDFFPLGMWTYKAAGYSSGGFQDMADHNCNAVRINTSASPAILDDAESKGLKCFIDIKGWTANNIAVPEVAPCEPEIKDLMETDFGYADSGGMMGHNGLMGYYIADEPKWDVNTSPEKAKRWRTLMQIMREIDPNNPVTWCNIGLGSRTNYVTDIKPHQLLIDVYPKYYGSEGNGDLRETFNVNGWEMTWYIEQYQNLLESYDCQTWVIGQAHRFMTQLEQPTAEEIRSQIWLSLAKGVKGLFFFIYEEGAEWEGLYETQLINQYNMLSQIYGQLDDHLEILLKLEKTDALDISVTGGGNRFHGGNAEVGTFNGGFDKYFIVANRNCESAYSGTYNDITIDSTTDPGRQFTDIVTGQIYTMGDTITFDLGDGKIFKIDETPSDLNQDGYVNNLDFQILAENWLQTVPDPLEGDISGNGFVDIIDFAMLAADWDTQ
jgi:hypothetical protein